MGAWTNSTCKETSVINGEVCETKKQNSYEGTAEHHDHKWYDPKSGQMGWTGSDYKRNPNYRD